MGIARLAQRYDVGIQNHCSVSRGRRDWVKKITGHTPVVYYHNLGVLSPRWLLTHLSWVTEEELPLLKEYAFTSVTAQGRHSMGQEEPLRTANFRR